MVSPVTMRGMLSMATKDEIRRRVDLVELIGGHVALKKAGRSYKGLCPFHHERTPSFVVDPEKGLWFCFGCKLGGDAFDFVMRIGSLSFMEAAEALARRAGVRLERSPEEAARAGERERMYRALEAAAGFFREQLLHPIRGAPARAYLERRGVDAATAERFRLGYAPAAWDDLQKVLGATGFPPGLLEKAGLVNPRSGGDGFYDLFRNRLMFPIVDLQDRVVGFGGRALDDAEPKYLNSRESAVFVKGRTLYALNWAREAVRKLDEIIVVEGNMDAVTAHQYGITNTVASLGTALTADQVQAMKRLASRAVIVYDADASGQAAMERAMAQFEEADLPVRVVVLPAGDPDEFLRTRGADAFRGLLAGALPVFEYQLRTVAARHDPATVDGKVRIVDELLPVVAAVSNPVRQAEYVRLLAERFALREDAVRQRLRARQGRRGAPRRDGVPGTGRAPGPEVPVASPDTARARAERWLLHVMVHAPEVRAELAARLSAGDFADPAHRTLADALLSAPDADVERLRGALDDEAAERLLVGLLFEDVPVEEKDREKVVNESVAYLVRRQRTEGRFEALRAAIAAAQASGDVQQVRRLQTEYEELIGLFHASRKGGDRDGQEESGA